jgi:Na+/citrate or Na+/malate symporter
MLQLIIATTLFFVLMFGLGFILNMLLKTTWLPIYAYVLLVVGLIYADWNGGALTEHLFGYTYVDFTPAVGGLIGAVLSGTAIRALRLGGYKMF